MTPVMPQIKNVVFLMLENRSLDNVLGWLYDKRAPQHVYPAGSPAAYDGLVAGRYHNPAHSVTGVHSYPVEPIPAKYQHDRVPAYDPYEAMREGAEWNGVMNQLFGNADPTKGIPSDGTPAQMLGFLQDYYARYMVEWQGLDALWTYTPEQLPRINSLAYQFAVSDRWFSSVPTQTNPNRAYSLCGTSLGREANQTLTAVEQYNVPTLINRLAEAGKHWGLYYEDIWQKGKCFTEYTFPQISAAKNGEVAMIEQFKAHAKAGSLPAFSYLEPKWGYGKGAIFTQGHDYHPPTSVAPGEQFLWDIYTALRNSPQWQDTLFIVTFDEHGGTYDHVAPPWGAINPDGIKGTKWGFDFKLYGARVPTLLISPYIAPQTVFRAPADSAQPFDHTSFIKTLLLWAGVNPANAGLGKRVPAAPSFDGVLADTIVNDGTVALQTLAGGDAAPASATASLTAAPPASSPLNGHFDGMPFASVRAILNANDSMGEIEAAIAAFKENPARYESTLEAEPLPKQ
ncbi:MAG TPA: hypothetical protein DEB56_00065 [Thiobacillus sp.]|nr:hypothetical protein [Thiobacillus sp.]